jgi:hypothetical protein
MPARQKSRQRAQISMALRPEATCHSRSHFFQSLGVEEDESQLDDDPFAEQLARAPRTPRRDVIISPPNTGAWARPWWCNILARGHLR